MKKLKLNYTCTDPDCAQYMAKVTDTRYSLRFSWSVADYGRMYF